MNVRIARNLNRSATLTLWSSLVPIRSPSAVAATRTMQTTRRGCQYYDSHGDYRADADTLEDPNQPLYSRQRNLPRLPVPCLEDTCRRFLPTALPLARTQDEAESLLEAVAKFPAQARELQQRLRQRAADHPDTSWLQWWWNTLGYLRVRDPIVVFVSYFLWCDDDPKLDALVVAQRQQLQYRPCLARSAALLPPAIRYAREMRRHQRPPDTLGKKEPIPLCSTQKKYMFHACRIPRREQDVYRLYFPTQQQVVISCRGQFFAVDLPPEEDWSQRQWRRILQYCVDQTAADNLPPSIGWFTGLPRDDWTELRNGLLKVGGDPMRDALEVLESSVFMLCLDVDEEIADDRDRALQFWHGGVHHPGKEYLNRWFDKSAAILVTQNGKLGFQGEHSMLDGMPLVDFNHAMIRQGQVEEDCLDDNPSDTSASHALPAITNIFQPVFDALTPDGRAFVDQSIAHAKAHLRSLADEYDLHVQHYYKYGANTMKQAGCSPDAYIQMAMQLASYRMMGEALATYESTQVLRFLHGRTETTRTVSPASLAFCQAMDENQPTADNKKSPEELRNHRFQLLQAACKSHGEYIGNAVQGQGVDRHFLGLSLCLDDATPPPDLFSNPLFVRSKQYRLSTSSLPELAPGFGPVVTDGFGMGYEPKPEACFVHVTARKEYGWTEPMCQRLAEALDDMRSLYDVKNEAPRSKL